MACINFRTVYLIVSGDRKFDNLIFLWNELDRLTKKIRRPLDVIHGCQYFWVKGKGSGQRKVGAEVLAEQWTFANYHTVHRYEPESLRNTNEQAYEERNQRMVDHALTG